MQVQPVPDPTLPPGEARWHSAEGSGQRRDDAQGSTTPQRVTASVGDNPAIEAHASQGANGRVDAVASRPREQPLSGPPPGDEVIHGERGRSRNGEARLDQRRENAVKRYPSGKVTGRPVGQPEPPTIPSHVQGIVPRAAQSGG